MKQKTPTEAPISAGATGNQRDFPGRWKKTKVIGARELIEVIIAQQK